jgi:hypothetical protein
MIFLRFSTQFTRISKTENHYWSFYLQAGPWKESRIHRCALELTFLRPMPLAVAASSPAARGRRRWQTSGTGSQFNAPRTDWWPGSRSGVLRWAPTVSPGRRVHLGPNSGEDRRDAGQEAMARDPVGSSCDNPPRKVPYYRLRPLHFWSLSHNKVPSCRKSSG